MKTSYIPLLGADRTGSSPESASRFTGIVLEWVERVVILALYTWLVARLGVGVWEDGNIANLLLLVSEGLVLTFVLIRRRARDVSRRPSDWVVAFTATCLPLLATSGGQSFALPVVLLLAGLCVQLSAKVILGRSFGIVPANRGLKREGPYRFVRHPMYAGYLLGHIGFLLVNPTWWNLAIYVGANALQIRRLVAEERLLSLDPNYRSYCESVRSRLIPCVF